MGFFHRFFKAVKNLLLKVGSIFFRAKPPDDPLLPLQNPPSTSTISTQSLLLQTPSPNSSPSTFHKQALEYGDNYVDDSFSWNQEENYLVETDHHVVFCSSVFLEETTEEQDEEEEEEEVKSVILVVEERWIKHYSSRQRILLVGEGNFSFSACLAVAFGCASNIIATSLDSQAFLKQHYNDAISNIDKLRSRGSMVMHGIDATTMATHKLLGQLKFDRVIYNFPYVKLGVVKNLPRQSQLEHHRRLVLQFMENARDMLSSEGEIHITHKTNGFHGEWRLESLARGSGLRLIEAVKFNHRDYHGYKTKCGFGGNNYFNCNPSKTYKFGLN